MTGKSVGYIENPIDRVIEAVVTNNVGYLPLRERLGDPFTKGIFTYMDCTGLDPEFARGIPDSGKPKLNPESASLWRQTTDVDMLNLHFYLHHLKFASVIPEEAFSERHPGYCWFEFHATILGSPLDEQR